MGVEYLTFNVLLHAKTQQKVVGHYIFKNPLKPGFSILIMSGVLDCNKIFLIRKTGFNGLLKVIGIEIIIISIFVQAIQ